MTNTPVLATPDPRPARTGVELPIAFRLASGEVVEGTLPAEHHRSLHLRMLHGQTRGLVEIAAGRRDSEGDLHIHTRRRKDHFLPGGGCGDSQWLRRILHVVSDHLEMGEDVFVGPAIHVRPSANKEDILWSRWAWIDMDGPEHLGRVDALLVRKPAAARIWSGASGGEHVYFPLARAIPARTVTDGTRTIVNPQEVTERTAQGGMRVIGYRDGSTGRLMTSVAEHWIEKGNLRLIHALGYTTRQGRRVYAADIRCRNRSRLMRLAGTVHSGSGEYARISYFHPTLPRYDSRILFGDLAEPTGKRPRRSRTLHRFAPDPLRQIPADVYFWRLAGIELPAYGNISCPNPAHPDVKPSCSVTDFVWYCHGCGAQGTLIDLWSVLNGGPTGDELAASSPEEFKRVRRLATEAMGLL